MIVCVWLCISIGWACMLIYECMCVCLSVGGCEWVGLDIYTHVMCICLSVCLYVCAWLYVPMCGCKVSNICFLFSVLICMYACMFVCVILGVYEYVCVYIYV